MWGLLQTCISLGRMEHCKTANIPSKESQSDLQQQSIPVSAAKSMSLSTPKSQLLKHTVVSVVSNNDYCCVTSHGECGHHLLDNPQ